MQYYYHSERLQNLKPIVQAKKAKQWDLTCIDFAYLCYRKQGERRLVVKPIHLNFNYWKRTGKAGSDTGFFYLCALLFLNEYRPLSDRPVIIGFSERRWLRDGKEWSSELSVQPFL